MLFILAARQFRPLFAAPRREQDKSGRGFGPACLALVFDPAFLAPALANAMLVSGFYVFLTSAPFLMNAKGLGAVAVGKLLSASACGLPGGTSTPVR